LSVQHRLSLWAPLGAYMIALVAAPGAGALPVPWTPWDKALHFAAYGLLGSLALRAFHGGWRRPRAVPAVLSLVLVAIWGAVDELRQAFDPARCASAGDWFADVAGAVAGLVLVTVLTAIPARGGA
jgi:VanZ family protein